MCWTILVDGEEIDCVGELQRAIAPAEIVFAPDCHDQAHQPEMCLCGVDKAATAKAAGYVEHWDYSEHWDELVWRKQRDAESEWPSEPN